MKKKFKLFDFTKEGKGVRKEDYVEDTPFTLPTFFKTFFRNFWSFSCLNFLYLLINFPLFFGLFALSGNLNSASSTPTNLFYPHVFAMQSIKNTPLLQSFFARTASEASVSVPTTATAVFFALTGLVLLTFGISNCGMAYVLRNYTKKEPVFLATDFFEAIRNNWKQALPLGIFDILACFVTVYVFNFWRGYNGFLNDIMFYLSIFVMVVYFFMRFYLYVLAVTFDLTLPKLIKNAFIFALVGVKRNFVAFFGILAVLLINYYVFAVFMPLGIVMPFVITISLCSFIAVYCTYPNIKRIMIDPYYPEAHEDDADGEEPIFTDRG